MSERHSLTFRGQDHAIPATYGLCTKCGALLQIEAWLEQTCTGRDPQLRASATKEEAK